VRIVRVCTLIVAIVACAWFALGVRQAVDTSRAETIVSQSGALSAAQSVKAASLLSAARALNPDREVEILRGQLALAENDPVRAKQILENVVRAEPMNIKAWFQLLLASHHDPHTASIALRHIGLLEPSLRRRR
jgi:hypothetical protein